MPPDPPKHRAGWESIAGVALGGLLCLGLAVLIVFDGGLLLFILWPVAGFIGAVGLFMLVLAGLAATGVIRPRDRGNTH